MNTLIATATLFTLTMGTVAVYPSITHQPPLDEQTVVRPQQSVTQPIIDVVFVLDTTASMDGLIRTAKDKIWSIATTMTSAQQTPNIRIGIVGFRDRGDEYVTRVIDLSDDLDSVYAGLMDFQAAGGGDGPESVNKALYDAVHNMSWRQDAQAYQAIFLFGDAPPHMDYLNEQKYPEILATAAQKGIIVNTVQCGQENMTVASWKSIAALGHGKYFQVEQAGSAVAMNTPFDDEMAKLSSRLDDTRLFYGSKDEKMKMESKVKATKKLERESSTSSLASRGAFNASKGGRKNLLGNNELVDAVTTGEVTLEEIDQDSLPEELRSMAPAAQRDAIIQKASEREELQVQIKELAKKRDDYIKEEVTASGNAEKSLDHQVYDAVRSQASKAGLSYSDGPTY